jgi:hypothetical protein
MSVVGAVGQTVPPADVGVHSVSTAFRQPALDLRPTIRVNSTLGEPAEFCRYS